MLLVLITLTCEKLRALREVTRGASPIWLVCLAEGRDYRPPWFQDSACLCSTLRPCSV